MGTYKGPEIKKKQYILHKIKLKKNLGKIRKSEESNPASNSNTTTLGRRDKVWKGSRKSLAGSNSNTVKETKSSGNQGGHSAHQQEQNPKKSREDALKRREAKGAIMNARNYKGQLKLSLQSSIMLEQIEATIRKEQENKQK